MRQTHMQGKITLKHKKQKHIQTRPRRCNQIY